MLFEQCQLVFFEGIAQLPKTPMYHNNLAFDRYQAICICGKSLRYKLCNSLNQIK